MDEEKAVEDPVKFVDDIKQQKYWTALAMVMGWNELAKLGKTLGEKAFFRLMRNDMVTQFIELGGNDPFTKEDAVVTIAVPYGGCPFLEFRAQDIDLMRTAVYEYDKEDY